MRALKYVTFPSITAAAILIGAATPFAANAQAVTPEVATAARQACISSACQSSSSVVVITAHHWVTLTAVVGKRPGGDDGKSGNLCHWTHGSDRPKQWQQFERVFWSWYGLPSDKNVAGWSNGLVVWPVQQQLGRARRWWLDSHPKY
jgi:hypothetical protein